MKKLSFFLMAMLLTLCVTNAFGEVYFSDSFSNVGTGSNATVSSRTGWSSLTQCYGQYNSGLRIGSSKNAGSITKTAMSNISGTKNLKVTIYTAKYNKDGNSFTITATNGTITSVTGVGKLSAGTLTVSPTGNAGVTRTTSKATWTDSYKTEFIISGATSSTTIKFATNKRAILGPITIEDEAASGDDEIETVDLGDLLKWSATSATVTVGADDNEFPTLTNTNDVAVSYTSSTPATATIDASTGAITLVAAGTTTISAFYEGGDDAGEGKVYAAKTVSYTLTVKPAPLVIEPIEGGIIDILTHGNFGANSNSYANFTGKQAANDGHSTAVYAGRTARNGDATQYNVQLNTIDKGRIATTTTGGLAKRVYVRWASQTANTNNRALYIYGSNDAFTGGETTDPSTKIGIVTFTTGAEEAYADLTGDYKHILITGSGAIYMDEIQVTWVSAEGTVVTPTISGDAEFIESTEISISAEDGLKVYYTLDGTDPTNASTEYTAPFTVSATTTVKAVAYDGENASDIASQTFKKLQVLTCEEAAELCAATESADKYVIRGYVTNIAYAYDAGYNNISFWMADTKNGGQVFEAYRAQPVAAADKAVKVGDYVEVIGKIVLYDGTTPETTQGGTYTIIPAPVVNHTITVSANPAEAGTVTGAGEYEEGATATLTATPAEGYEFVKWTENEVEVSTDAEYTFEVLADHNLVANFKKSVVTHDFYVEDVTVTEGQWSIDLAGSWNEQAFVLKLWQDNTQGFGTYAANAETGYTAALGVKELTPTAPGYYTDMQDGTFTFQGTMTDGTDIYEVFLKGALASSTGTGELEAKNEVYFTYEDGEWMIEAFADDQTWGLMLAVSAETDPETGENLVYGQYVTDIEAGITEEVAGTCQLYFDDFSGCYVFKGGLATASGNIYPTLYASSLTLMTNDLVTGPSWVGEFAGVDYYEVLMMAADYSWELDLHARNCTGANGTYTIDVVDEAEGAYSTFMGSTIVTGELTIEDGMYEANVTTVDSEGNPVMSISVLAWAAAAEEYDIVITDATVTDNTSGYNIDLTGEWEGHDIKVEVCDELTAETILANFFIDGGIANDGDQAEGTVEATVNEGVVTITGTFECLGSGAVYNVTISGTLPVEEPEVIEYELNGGVLPAPAVPTNEELWIAFMPYYQEYYDVVRAEQPIANVAVFLSAGMGDDATIFTSEDSDYKWLGDYIIKVTTEQSAALTTLAYWKFNVQAFFNANQYTAWPKSADFTEAGKPENWGAAYEAAHEVVLPTEPVAEDYVLPTPTKSGSTFKGWYDNAEGIGEAYTVIPAGWAGTLYAIWEQGTTTALENIAVEGKAVKAIINGQLIIIKNGVQYNAQGQVIK